MTLTALKLKWQRQYDLIKHINDDQAKVIKRFLDDLEKIEVTEQFTLFEVFDNDKQKNY